MPVIDYSELHIRAFNMWRSLGIKRLPDDYLTSLLEDPNFEAEVGQERARRHYGLDALESHPPTPRPAPAVAKGPAPVRMASFRDADLSTKEGLATWVTREGRAATPIKLWDATRTETAKSFDAIIEAFTVMRTKVNALEARLNGLESAAAKTVSGVKWAGVFEPGRQYHEGELCSRAGLWLAKATTTSTPGASLDWVLIVRAKSKDVE